MGIVVMMLTSAFSAAGTASAFGLEASIDFSLNETTLLRMQNLSFDAEVAIEDESVDVDIHVDPGNNESANESDEDAGPEATIKDYIENFTVEGNIVINERNNISIINGTRFNITEDGFYLEVANLTFVNLTADMPCVLINPLMDVVDIAITNISGVVEFNNVTLDNNGVWWVYSPNPIAANIVRKPEKPTGPSELRRNNWGTYKTIISRSQTGDEIIGALDIVRYGWDWNGDNSPDEWSGYGLTGYTISYNPPPTTTFDKMGETIKSHAWSSSGTYYIQVVAENLLGSRSDWSNTKKVTVWDTYAIIVRGGEVGDNYFDIESNRAYNRLISLGYTHDRICYLNVDTSENHVDYRTTRGNIQWAITTWLDDRSTSKDKCFLYFVDHGSNGGYFYFDGNQDGDLNDVEDRITATELDGWINQVTYQVCTVVIDSCYSGDFIPSLSANKRIVITSSDGNNLAYFGIDSFAFPFFNALGNGRSMGKAWEEADAKISNGNHPEQNPQIDDDGNGAGHGTTSANTLPLGGDGSLALDTYP